MTTSFIMNNAAKMAWCRSHCQLGWMALGMLVGGGCAPSGKISCEEGDKPRIWDNILPKNQDGNVSWDKAGRQIGDQLFWDNLAKAAGAKVQSALDTGIPTHLSYGFVSGFCSGMALKKVGRALSVVLGMGFITLQTLNYYGYVKVDHGRIKKDFDDFLDLNKDGTVDTEDAAIAYNKLLKILEFNLPAGGGFAAGFAGGLRSG